VASHCSLQQKQRFNWDSWKPFVCAARYDIGLLERSEVGRASSSRWRLPEHCSLSSMAATYRSGSIRWQSLLLVSIASQIVAKDGFPFADNFSRSSKHCGVYFSLIPVALSSNRVLSCVSLRVRRLACSPSLSSTHRPSRTGSRTGARSGRLVFTLFHCPWRKLSS
jgi:hypothetical protein